MNENENITIGLELIDPATREMNFVRMNFTRIGVRIVIDASWGAEPTARQLEAFKAILPEIVRDTLGEDPANLNVDYTTVESAEEASAAVRKFLGGGMG